MNIPSIKAADIPLQQLAGNTKVSDKEKIAEVSRQFEAVLLRQILQDARKSSTTSTSPANASTSSIYDDMINNQLADCISRSGSIGLGKSLQGQLVHQVLPNTAPGAAVLVPLTAASAVSHASSLSIAPAKASATNP